MNLPWTTPPLPPPPALPEGPCEAMAAELSPRGVPHVAFGIEFPPGDWVDVTPGQAAQLAWCEWVTVRQKEPVNG